MEYTTFTAQEFIDGKIIEMNDANKVYRAMAKTIDADTEIADNLLGRGSENRALLKAIYLRLNEVIGEEE
jgi:hypothetical protein|tara:strand:+ start:230 stop:439 length:210 start_codon:yes stop_codon:yes gene_type:complete